MFKTFPSLSLTAAALLSAGPLAAQGTVDPDHGIVGVSQLLRGLGSVKRLLIIGAHPDDEDTSLLTWVERGLGGDAAYLSLNRGEGGQNLIGPELGVGLGLIRTGELLAARRLDGGQQFFSRAYDFGYSKSSDETFRFWPRDSLFADVVAVVRRFRPQVIVSTFSGTRRDGHGQHQVAGILAHEVYYAAGDPDVFPEQLAEGLRPWTPLKLYRSTRFNPNATTLRVETGTLDPLYGRSYHQIAMASRSRHRSQDMGTIESLGPRQASMMLEDSRVAGGSEITEESSPFEGIDTTLVGLAPRGDGDLEDRLVAALAAYGDQLERARRALAGWESADLVDQLAAALTSLRQTQDLAEETGPDGAELRFALAEQERKLASALVEAAGVIVDAFTDDDLVVPGQSFEVTVVVWNGGSQTVEVGEIGVRAPPGWGLESLEQPGSAATPGTITRHKFSLTVPDGAPPSRPYFLEEPRPGAFYAWPPGSSERGLPFGAPVVGAEVELSLAGQDVLKSVEAVYRFADQAVGEVRRPLHVVPAVGIDLAPATMVWPLDRREGRTISVGIRGESPEGVSGRVWLEAPEGWRVTPSAAEFQIATPGAAGSVEFVLNAPQQMQPGSHRIAAVAETPDGHRYRLGYSEISYPHIRRSFLYHEAAARIEAFDLNVDRALRVGYVSGAGDAVAEAIEAMGLSVERLDERAIGAGDLSGLDVIVLGIRAFETNPTLVANNRRLLDWVEAGGTLIAQYQQYRYFRGGYAPYPLDARRPHDRVSDEGAAMRVLVPDHPAFNEPNVIRAEDFDGWVQERGLYFANEWDDNYQALLETADPGEDPKRGGLLVARWGDGIYVYTGLALFRQLPAGVPGAYRLLANLLSLKG